MNPASPAFRPTRWSLVADARGEDPAAARAAMEQLCAAYWFPLYAWLRRRGHGPEDAEDLTQSFFVRLLERDTFAAASPGRGKLRSFLLHQLQNHLADAARHRLAEKRGARVVHISLDDAEARLTAEEPADQETPETLYHRRWALEVLSRALTTLETECAAAGEAAAFTELRPALTDATARALDSAAVAQALGIPRDQVKTRVHRLRRRFREAVLAVISETMRAPHRAAVEQEMRDLLRCLAPPGSG